MSISIEHIGTLQALWNGDITLTAEQRQWVRQALDVQERGARPVASGPAPLDAWDGSLLVQTDIHGQKWATGRGEPLDAPVRERVSEGNVARLETVVARVQTQLRLEEEKFQRETRRTSDLYLMVQRFIDDGSAPEALRQDAADLLARPVNAAPLREPLEGDKLYAAYEEAARAEREPLEGAPQERRHDPHANELLDASDEGLV